MRGTITTYEPRKGKATFGYRFRAGKDKSTGKWRWISEKGFATKREADDELTKALVEYDKTPGTRDPRTFDEFFEAHIKENCEEHCEATTVEGYRAKAAYASRMFGNVPVTKLKPLQIQTALNTLRQHGGKKTKAHPKGRPLSAKTVREIASIVNATLKAALYWGVIDFNPMQRVKVKRADKREAAVLEKPELERLLAACADHEWLYPLLLLDAATGARRGELLALNWSDVDFDSRVLTISKALAQTKAKGIFLKVPKRRKARHFSISQSTLEALRSHRAKQSEMRAMFGSDYRTDLNLIIGTPTGDYLKPDSVTSKVSLLARRCGFPKGVSLHTLRHTHGSHLLSLGIPLPAVSKRLGHANTNITASVYSHALEKDDLASAEVWEKAMGDLMFPNVPTK